jgi:hypothetical protein
MKHELRPMIGTGEVGDIVGELKRWLELEEGARSSSLSSSESEAR